MSARQTPPARASHEAHRPVFVGREREIDELLATTDDVSRGSGRIVLLGGEAGIGKTRTAQELGSKLRKKGFQVIWGRSHETGGAPAYWPWIQILRACVANTPTERLAGMMGAGVADIAQLVVEVRERFPAMTTPSLDPEQARFRLFDSITAFLKNIAVEHPVMLVVDDLHTADKPSLLLLQFLGREIVESRLLIVGTYRDAGIDRDHPMSQSIGELAREPVTRRLVLKGLGDRDIARYIELTAGVTPSPGLAAALCSKTEGNPFFAGEIVRLMLSEGKLARGARDWDLPTAIPAGVRGVILRRLDALTDGCRSLLVLAAVIGREFGLNVLQQVSGLSTDALLTTLEEADAGGVIVDVAGAPGRYSFSHALIQETLYRELTSTQRIRLHRQVGEALELVYRAHPERGVAELAYHFFAAAPGGTEEKAIDYAVRAGNRAMSLMAYEEAARCYDLALQALELGRASDGGLLSDLLLMLAEACWSAGECERAKSVAMRAADVARGLDSPAQFARAALGYAGRLPAFGAVTRDDTVMSILEQALARLDQGETGLRARLMARLAEELTLSPAHERRWLLSRQAVDLARRQRDPSVLAPVLKSTYWSHWIPERAEDRVAFGTEISELGEQGGDRALALEGFILRLIGLTELGDPTTIQQEFHRCERWTNEIKQPYFVWLVAVLRGFMAFLQGRLSDVERLAGEAAAHGMRTQNQNNANLFFAVQTGHLLWLRGRFEELEPLLLGLGNIYPLLVHTVEASLAITYAEQGRTDEARARFERFARNDFADVPRHVGWLCTIAFLAEVCAFLDDAAHARRLYEMLAPFESRYVSLPPSIPLGAADHYLGLLATTLRQWDDAALHFQNAIEIEQRLGTSHWVARTQAAHALMLVRRGASGDLARAGELLDHSSRTATALGIPSVAGRASAIRAQLADGPKNEPVLEPERRTFVFQRQAEIWTIVYEGRVFRLKDAKGVRYLAHLIGHAGEDVPATELVGLGVRGGAGHVRTSALGGLGPILDAEAKGQYKRRLAELRADLAEAERCNDPGRATTIRAEIDHLVGQLTAAVGLSGRDRAVGSAPERARVTVTKGIRSVLEKLRRLDPLLGHHLSSRVRTGAFCTYTPDPSHPIDWVL